MQLKPGTKLQSIVCDTDVMVIKGTGDVFLTCGGAEMVADRSGVSGQPAIDPAFASGTAMGNRYQTADGQIELLCIRPGKGSLTVDGIALETKVEKESGSSTGGGKRG